MDKIKILKGKMRRGVMPDFVKPENTRGVREYHRTIDGYESTPLFSLPNLSRSIGLGSVYVKDESYRFGLNAFKGLGASYAINELLNTIGDPAKTAFVTATDGNHGKGVAWAAEKAGSKAFVFMPAGSSEERVEAIRSINDTHVEVTPYNYSDAVRYATEFAEKNGYHLVQDTGFEGYEKIPNDITKGYTTMVAEVIEQLDGERPTHVVIQAGVGSVAGAVVGYLSEYFSDDPPTMIVVEPTNVACIYESAEADSYTAIGGNQETDMAGLNCGEPNLFTLPILTDYVAYYAKCPDWVTWNAMRTLANPIGDDPKIVSGESGAVGFGFVQTLCSDPEYREYRDEIGLSKDSHVLVFSTEGATDKANYDRIIEGKKIS